MAVLASLTSTSAPTAIGWDTNVASKFTPASSMTVTKLEVYMGATQASSMRIGLSQPVVSGSNPTWLNGDTAFLDVASGLAVGWNVVTLPASVALTSGTDYAVAIVGGANQVGGSNSTPIATGLAYTLSSGNSNGTAPIWSTGSTSFYMPFRLDDNSVAASSRPPQIVVRSRAVSRAAVI